MLARRTAREYGFMFAPLAASTATTPACPFTTASTSGVCSICAASDARLCNATCARSFAGLRARAYQEICVHVGPTSDQLVNHTHLPALYVQTPNTQIKTSDRHAGVRARAGAYRRSSGANFL